MGTLSSTAPIATAGSRESKRPLLLELVLGGLLIVLPVAGASIGRGEIGNPSAAEVGVKIAAVLSALLLVALYGKGRWPAARPWWILVTLAGFLLVAAPFALNPAISIPDAGLLLGSTVAVGVLASDVGTERLLRALSSSSAALVIAGFAVERWFERSVQNALGIDGLFGFDRVAGVFTDPNTLGQTAAVGALAALLLLTHFKRGDLAAISGAICLVGLVASQSRTAAGGVVVALALTIVRSRTARAIGVGGLMVVAALVATLPGAVSFAVDELTRSGDPQEVATFTGRTRVWTAVLDEVPERPIIGYGAGSSPEVLSGLIRDGRVTWPALHAHNAVLQMMLSGGVVGLALLIASVARWFGYKHRDRRLSPLVWLVIIGTVTEVLVVRSPSTYWLLIAGVLAVRTNAS